MKTITIKTISLILLIGAFAFNSNLQAQQNNNFGLLSFNKAVNVSGKQRMLTQKMAKSYLYLIQNPTDVKAKKDLMVSKIIFEKQNKIIRQNASYKTTKDRISKVNLLWLEYKKLLETTPNYDNAKKIIDLNTDLLKATNNVVLAVINESKGANKSSTNILLEDEDTGAADLELKKIINTAGRQRMLSQRLALYYFANHITLKDSGNEQMLKNVYNELDGAVTLLLISEFNNGLIEEKLGIAMSKWEQIKSKKAKLMTQGINPTEMYKISNELTKAFNAVTGAYEKTKA